LTLLEGEIRSDGIHPSIEQHLSKYRGLMPTLTLICHLADGQTDPVGVDAAHRGVAWCDYLKCHAKRIYHAAENPE